MENGSLNLLKKEVCQKRKEVEYNTTIPAVTHLTVVDDLWFCQMGDSALGMG